MINITIASSVKGFDNEALKIVSELIIRYLLIHRHTGSVLIECDRIVFTTFLIKKEEILFDWFLLRCVDGKLCGIGKLDPFVAPDFGISWSAYMNSIKSQCKLASLLDMLGPGETGKFYLEC